MHQCRLVEEDSCCQIGAEVTVVQSLKRIEKLLQWMLPIEKGNNFLLGPGLHGNIGCYLNNIKFWAMTYTGFHLISSNSFKLLQHFLTWVRDSISNPKSEKEYDYVTEGTQFIKLGQFQRRHVSTPF